MVRRALIGLTALVGVASAQPVPNATWTLSSPRTAPTVEWSPDGRYVALSSDSSVEVLDGTTLKVVWSRTVSGALPGFLSMYPHPDRAHFAANSQSVYIRTAAGGTYTQFAVKTGDVLRTHSFSDWSGDYVLSPQSGNLLVAVKLSVAGGTETMDIRAYDETTLALVNSRSASHAYVSGVDFPIGRYSNKPYVGFYGKLLNPRNTSTLTWDSGTTENWNVAFDPDFGVVQTVVNNGIFNGSQHVNAAGSVDWTNASMPVVTGVQFAKTATSTLGMNPTGTTLQVFNYATGGALYESNLLGGGAFSFGSGCVNMKDGRFISNTGTSGMKSVDVFMADATSASYQNVSFPVSGVANIESTPGGVYVSGNANFYGMLTSAGASAWMKSGNTAPVVFAASKTGAFAAEVMGAELDVVNAADGSPYAMYAGAYTNAIWISDTQLLAVKADGSADRLDVAAGSITLHDSLPVMFQAGGSVSDNGKYAIGYANGNIHVFNLTTAHDTLTAYPQFGAGWGSFFKTSFVSNSRIGLLEKSGSDFKWSLYDLPANKLQFVSSLTYAAPASGWPDANLRGALSKSVTPVSAFFTANGNGIDGGATSQLKIVRFSDGKVLSTIDNIFTAVNAMKFSAEGNALYVATGGTADSGVQDLVSVPVPTWISSVTITPSPATGGNVQVKVKLAGPAPATGVRVQFAVSAGGATIPALRIIGAGATVGIVNMALPAVATDTSFTVTANVEGDSEMVSASVVDLAPVPASITALKASFYHSQAESVTVTLTGNAPTGGTVVNLSSNNPNITVPATVTIAAGTSSKTVNVGSIASSTREDATFTATLGSTSVNCTVTALANIVGTLSFSPSSVMAGTGSTGTVAINGQAGPGGVVVTLASGSSAASVPASVTIPENAASTTFAVTTLTSASGSTPAITATYGGSTKTTNLTITQTTVSSLTLSPSSVPAGNSSTATVTIGTAATTGGLPVALTYTGTGVSGPASVTVAAGATTATYTVTTTAALTGQATGAGTTATVGSSAKTAALTITPTTVTAFTFNNPSITGATNSTGTITISAPAPAGGLVVTLTNDKTALVTVPASITVAAGSTTFNFSWPTAPTLASQTATMTAKISGVGPTATQTVVPPKVTGISFTPNTVTGGTGSSFTITLDGPAPAGYSITLTNSNTGRMTITSINPAKPTAGQTSVSGSVTTTTGTATSANLTATGIGGGTAMATLTIN